MSQLVLDGRTVKEAPKLRSIGKYQLIASLGQGGMAKVYLALMAGPAGFNKLMVVKVLRDDVLTGSEDAVRMFWDEARLAAQLVHPNIVHTYEVGEIDGRYFLAMEYLDGQTYRSVQLRVEQSGGLPLPEDIRILAETARGLHYSHELKGFNGQRLGVVHRDVSPQNVFITYDGQVKLLDFGIAKQQSAEHMTQVGVIKGKLDYIAPEQLRGEQIDGRADVFALGAMLWEAVTGQRFGGGRKTTDVAKVHARIAGSEPKVRALKPDVSEELASIIDRAIALDPNDRYPNASAFADALEAHLEAIGAKPSAKSLSGIVSPMFVAERGAMQSLIDQQVQMSKSGLIELGDATGDLPRVGGPDLRSASGVNLLGNETSTGSRRDVFAEAASSGHTPTRSRLPLLASVLVASLVGGGIAWYSRGDHEAQEARLAAERRAATEQQNVGAVPATPTTPPITALPSSPSEPAPIQATTVIIGLRVSPPDAQVTLDGAPLALPFSGEFRKSSSLHHIEAIAEGYRPYKRLMAFDQSREVDIVLEPAPQQPARRSPQRATTPQSAREATPEPRVSAPEPEKPTPAQPGGEIPRSRVKRGDIDVSDPYSSQ